MGIFARLKMGWSLARDSFGVLRDQPELALFPLLSGVAGLVFVGLLFGGSAVLGLFEGAAGYVVLVLFYLGSAFIAAFFNAGLVYCAREAFAGREPSVRDGIDAAWRQRVPLFAWAVASATVGLLLRAIESQDNIVASILAAIVSVGWSILTYFIVPVIVFEDVGVGEMFRRSGETFKETWGETAGASFGVGIITALFTLAGLAVAAIVFVALGSVVGAAGFAVGVGLAVVFVLVAFLAAAALGAIAKTALYVYATEGERPAAFDDVDFERGAA